MCNCTHFTDHLSPLAFHQQNYIKLKLLEISEGSYENHTLVT